jgi:hypothetical protein
MSITRVQSQVTWAASASKTVNSATEVVSDVFTLDASCTQFAVQLSADNQGTPASGDVANWRIQWSTGDILQDSGDDFDTSEHAQFLAALDTWSTNTPGEDPALRTILVDVITQKFRLACTCPQAGTRNIVIAARVEEMRAA